MSCYAIVFCDCCIMGAFEDLFFLIEIYVIKYRCYEN